MSGSSLSRLCRGRLSRRAREPDRAARKSGGVEIPGVADPLQFEDGAQAATARLGSDGLAGGLRRAAAAGHRLVENAADELALFFRGDAQDVRDCLADIG